jgi:hypothetical protein
MIYKLILFCLLIFLQNQSSLAANFPSKKYTIHASELEHITLIRLADIFTLIDEWNYFTIDGFTIQAGNQSSENFHNQNWLLMVDDQIIRTQIFGQANLNLLGLSTDQIDSIEVYPNSTSVNGVFSNQGLIHIHTTQIEQGLIPRVQIIYGNQTGDPGPYRYTKFKTDNIDRIAVDKAYHISYGDSSGYINAGHYIQVFYPTNPRISNRIEKIYKGEFKRIRSLSYSLQAGSKSLPGSPQFSFYQTAMNNFFFFKPFGQEIPTKNKFLFAGLNGNFIRSLSLPLFFRFSYTKNALAKRNNVLDYNFDWKNELLDAEIYFEIPLKNNELSLGLNILKRSYSSDYFNNTQNIQDYSIYGCYNFNEFKDHNFEINGLFCNSNAGSEFNFSFYERRQFMDVQALLIGISVSQTNTLTNNPLWNWSEKGYDFVSDVNVDYEIDGALSKNKNLSFKLSWEREQDFLPALTSGINYQYIWGFNRENQSYHFDKDWDAARSPIEIKTDQQFKIANIFLKLNHNINEIFKHNLYIEYNKLLGNENNYQKLIPSQKINYRLTVNPVDNFSIWAMLKYRSSVFWFDYRYISQESDGKYSANLSEILSLDIAINKWFWKKRIKTSILFNNLLNRKEITHPIGASMDLRFFAQMEIYFNLL